MGERAELGRIPLLTISNSGTRIITARTVDLRDDLIARVRRLTGVRRKSEIINAALETFVDQHEAYRNLLALRGKVRFRASSSALLRERHGSRR